MIRSVDPTTKNRWRRFVLLADIHANVFLTRSSALINHLLFRAMAGAIAAYAPSVLPIPKKISFSRLASGIVSTSHRQIQVKFGRNADSCPSGCGLRSGRMMRGENLVCSSVSSDSSSSSPLPAALLFDCDGVLVDTEKDGHRISFNDTFAEVVSKDL